MIAVMPTSGVFRVARIGCHEVKSTSKHWTCLFPQHGPGRKHKRRIELQSWQELIVEKYAGEFVRGLMHSEALDRLGVEWRFSKPTTISVARRAAVARLDAFVGPKY